MRWIGGVQGYSFEKLIPYVIGARSKEQPLLKFINFGILGLVHNSGDHVILPVSKEAVSPSRIFHSISFHSYAVAP